MVDKFTLGIDIGTTGVKASVLNVDRGMVVAHSLKEHPLFHPKPGFSEGVNYRGSHPRRWWAVGPEDLNLHKIGKTP